MANTYKGEIQDYEGNVVYPHTEADVVFCTDGETVQNKLNKTEEVLGNITGVTDSVEVADSAVLPTSKALNQVFQSVSNGKSILASAITDRGIPTAADAAFQTMADNIGNLSQPTGNAAASQVLAGYTFSSGAGTGLTGTMTNRGAVKGSINAGQSYTVPAGYHNGTGTVTANSLASQTAATAAAANISSGKTAWVNGVKVTGSGADNTANYNAGYSAGRGSITLKTLGYLTASQSGDAASSGYANKSIFNLASISGYKNLVLGSNAIAIVAGVETYQANAYATGFMDGDQININADINWNNFNNANYPNNGRDSVFGWRLVRFWYNPNSGNLYAMSYQTAVIKHVMICAIQ